MAALDFRKILVRRSVADPEVCIFREETEICDSVDLWSAEIVTIKYSFGKEVMDFELAHLAKHLPLQWQSIPQIPRFTNPREHVKQRIKPCSGARSAEVPWFDIQMSVPQAQLLNESIQAPFQIFKKFEVLIDNRLGRTENRPHMALCKYQNNNLSRSTSSVNWPPRRFK